MIKRIIAWNNRRQLAKVQRQKRAYSENAKQSIGQLKRLSKNQLVRTILALGVQIQELEESCGTKKRKSKKSFIQK